MLFFCWVSDIATKILLLQVDNLFHHSKKRKFQAAAGEICRSIVAFSGESFILNLSLKSFMIHSIILRPISDYHVQYPCPTSRKHQRFRAWLGPCRPSSAQQATSERTTCLSSVHGHLVTSECSPESFGKFSQQLKAQMIPVMVTLMNNFGSTKYHVTLEASATTKWGELSPLPASSGLKLMPNRVRMI